jgi:hypothetical protein
LFENVSIDQKIPTMSHIESGFLLLPTDIFPHFLLSFISLERDILSMRLTCKRWASQIQLPEIDATTDFDKPISSIYHITDSDSSPIDLSAIIKNKIIPFSSFVTELRLEGLEIREQHADLLGQYLSSSTSHLKTLVLEEVKGALQISQLLPLATGIESLQFVSYYRRNPNDESAKLLPDLSTMTNLRSLGLLRRETYSSSSKRISDMLLTCPNLTSLTLSLDDYTDLDIQASVARLTNLTYLQLFPTYKCELLIPKLPKLRCLNIPETVSIRDVDFLRAVQIHPCLREIHACLPNFDTDFDSESSTVLFETIKKNTVLSTLELLIQGSLCPPSMELIAALRENQSLTSFGFEINEEIIPSLTALLSSSKCRLFDINLRNTEGNTASLESVVKMIESIKIHRQIRITSNWRRHDALQGESQRAEMAKAAERSGCISISFHM